MAKVLVVDDSATIRAAMGAMLRGLNHVPHFADNGETAIRMYCESPPSVVLLDVNMPGLTGYETATRMREALPAEWTPIIFLSANEGDQNLQRAVESGGDDYLVKPVSAVVLSAKMRSLSRLDDMRRKLSELSNELTAANLRLERIAQQDGLTGIANRRSFDAILAREYAAATRKQAPFSLVMCDVDCFKAFNDRYGHLAGDECLRKVGAAFASACLRGTDVAARYGGEEFALLLPDTAVDGASRVVDKARDLLLAAAIPHERSEAGDIVTFSAGVTALRPAEDARSESIVGRADEALYRAKHNGRNRTVVL